MHFLQECYCLRGPEHYISCGEGSNVASRVREKKSMFTKIGTAAAVAVLAFAVAPSDSFAASKNKADNSYRNQHECQGGACTALNPDRQQILPNQSAQFYKRQKGKKHPSSNNS